MFKIFLLSVSFVYLFAFVGACSKKTRNYLEDSATTYSVYPKPTRFCSDKRNSHIQLKFNQRDGDGECETNLVPGLGMMVRGVSKFHFPSSPNDEPPIHGEVFKFTCYDSIDRKVKQFENFTVPSEVILIQSQPKTLHDQHIISAASLLNSFIDDLELKKPENAFISNLAEMNLTSLHNFRSAGYLAIRVDHYIVRLTSSLPPTSELTDAFNLLPMQLENNVKLYYEFTRKFGTHVRYEATYGGKLIALVLHTSENDEFRNSQMITSVDTLMKEVLKIKPNERNKITVLSVGGDPHHMDLGFWTSSVKTHPVPITSRYIPLYSFLERYNNDTLKSHYLQKMMKYEEGTNDLKRLLFELNVLPRNNKLGNFVKETVKKEKDFVCLSPEILYMVQKGIVSYNNIKFDKFVIKCTIKYETDEEHKIVLRQYFLIPGVCLTLKIHTPLCDSVEYSLPPGTKCVVFYHEPGCSPFATKVILKSGNDINKAFSETKSMRLCTDYESGSVK